MPVARLALASFLLCTLSAFAQQQPSSGIPSVNLPWVPNEFVAWPSADAFAGPLRMVPERAGQTDSTQSVQDSQPNSEAHKRALDALNVLTQMLAENHIDPNSVHPWVEISPEGVLTSGVDETCYSIRSYVVARDNKDSDTTHLVLSSTCQPARQYGLKTTVMKPDVQGK